MAGGGPAGVGRGGGSQHVPRYGRRAASPSHAHGGGRGDSGVPGRLPGALNGSYVKPALLESEVAGYKAAGVLPWRVGAHGPEVLLGVNFKGEREFFGGKRNPGETCALRTAVRELHEETNLVLTDGVHGKTMIEALHTSLAGGPVVWIMAGKYVFYTLDVSALCEHHARSVGDLPDTIKESFRAHRKRHKDAEMSTAAWVALADLLVRGGNTEYAGFVKVAVRDPAFKEWAVRVGSGEVVAVGPFATHASVGPRGGSAGPGRRPTGNGSTAAAVLPPRSPRGGRRESRGRGGDGVFFPPPPSAGGRRHTARARVACRYYLTADGCRNGDACRYAHE